MKVAPAVSISYVVYENVRKELGLTWGAIWLCLVRGEFDLDWCCLGASGDEVGLRL